MTRNITLTYGFRWSFLREPYGENNEWTSWSLAAYDPTRPASDACNGIIIVPGSNPCGDAATQLGQLGISLPLSAGTPGPNRALVNNNNHAIAPRLGIAWDPWGDGKTAIRAGVGQFFQREPVGLDLKQAFNAPFVINATEARTLDAVSPTGLTSPSVSPCCSKNPAAVVPNSWQYNLSVQRELKRNMTLQLGYVGNAGIHLTSMLDLNAVPRADWVQASYLNASTGLNALRPASNFGSIAQYARWGHASYNAFQALYKWQLGNYSTIQAAYTYSHSIANVELDNSSGSVNQQGTTDQSNPRLDRGSTNINRPHVFVFNDVYYLPKLSSQAAFVRETLGGWELNSILTVNSGASLSVFTSQTASDNLGGTLQAIQGSGYSTNPPNFRPDRTGVSCNAGENGNQILNVNAFTYVGYVIGNVGNVPRGYCYGPAYRNFDMQLAKNWYFKERFRIKFSMDFFNMFNHANFYGNTLEGAGFNASHLECGTTVCSPTNDVVTAQAPGQNNGFGKASAVHPGRELQYTLRFYF